MTDELEDAYTSLHLAVGRLLEPWADNPRQYLVPMFQLFEAQEAALEGGLGSLASFSAKRRLLNLIKNEATADIVFLLLELARVDDEATNPFQLILRRRPENRAIRDARNNVERSLRKSKKKERDYALFLRVIDVRSRDRLSYDAAITKVASGEDGPLGLLQIKPQAVSEAMVRAAFTRFNNSAKKNGFIYRRRGMFAARTYREPMPRLPKSGRPKKV